MLHKQPVPSRPQIELHTPEVDFIENRLTEYHPAFDVSKVRYSNNQGQFVSIVPPCSQGLTVPNVSTPSQARPVPAPIAKMEFWDSIFLVAVKRLDEESDIKSKWSIRHLSKWDDIQATLEEAQNEYNFKNQPKTIAKARRAKHPRQSPYYSSTVREGCTKLRDCWSHCGCNKSHGGCECKSRTYSLNQSD